MLNHITVAGRLTRTPELKVTQQNVDVCSFSIACDRDYVAKGQEREVDFINIVAWRNTAKFVTDYFAKGDMIIISGRLQIRDWTDKDGSRHTIAEVLADSCYFGGSKRTSSGSDFQEEEVDDGDLPF